MTLPVAVGGLGMVAVTSYTELIEGLKAQLGELNIRYEDFDDLAGFAPGLSGKVFGPAQVKRLGPEKLFDAIRAAGLRLRIEEDPEQAAKMKTRIADNFIPRQANQARAGNHSSPAGRHMMSRVFKHLSKKGGKARMAKMTKTERFQHQQAASNARWARHRKRVKAALKASRTREQRAKLAKVSAEVVE
jgi:hypothetical protein